MQLGGKYTAYSVVNNKYYLAQNCSSSDYVYFKDISLQCQEPPTDKKLTKSINTR